jgi:hypothetical protein
MEAAFLVFGPTLNLVVGYGALTEILKRRFYNEKKQAMALAGNAGNNFDPNSVRASPDTGESYPNTKTCRGNRYAYPADGDASAAYTDPCPTNGDTCAAYANPYPADSNADTAYTDTSPNSHANA